MGQFSVEKPALKGQFSVEINIKEKVQSDYMRHFDRFVDFLGRSPDTATSEDVRRFQLHLAKQPFGVPTVNAAISALRFLFNITLERPELARALTTLHQPRKAPIVLSQDEMVRLIEAAPGLKYKAAFGVAYGAGLRVSEVVALKVSDIDSQRMTLRVEQGIGGAHPGRRGRGASGKTPFVAAVATTEDGKPDQIILRRVKAFSKFAIRKLSSTALASGADVTSDGLACFLAVSEVGCSHTVIKTGSGPKAAKTPAFKWVNTVLGNIKAALVGTYRAVHEKHVPRYLAEFEYRFNRRYDLAAIIPRLAFIALRTAPMPYRLLKLADVAA